MTSNLFLDISSSYIYIYISFFQACMCQDCSLARASKQGEITQMEVQQNKVNANDKSAYKDLTEKVKELCTRFGNELSAVKTHFKGKAKSHTCRACQA